MKKNEIKASILQEVQEKNLAKELIDDMFGAGDWSNLTCLKIGIEDWLTKTFAAGYQCAKELENEEIEDDILDNWKVGDKFRIIDTASFALRDTTKLENDREFIITKRDEEIDCEYLLKYIGYTIQFLPSEETWEVSAADIVNLLEAGAIEQIN